LGGENIRGRSRRGSRGCLRTERKGRFLFLFLFRLLMSVLPRACNLSLFACRVCVCVRACWVVGKKEKESCVRVERGGCVSCLNIYASSCAFVRDRNQTIKRVSPSLARRSPFYLAPNLVVHCLTTTSTSRKESSLFFFHFLASIKRTCLFTKTKRLPFSRKSKEEERNEGGKLRDQPFGSYFLTTILSCPRLRIIA
jgi:hypothetical protein